MKKMLLPVMLLLVLAAIGGLFYLLSSLNGLVKDQVELHGSNTLQTPVSVGAVNIKLLEGFGEITGFSIQNPEGYSKAKALSFHAIRLDMDTTKLGKMPIIIEELTIDSLTALVEMSATADSNINALLNNVKSAAGNAPKSASDTTVSSDTNEAAEVLVLIKRLKIKDTSLALDLTALGDKEYQETLPTFVVENIGTPNGVPPAQLGAELANAVLKKLKADAQKKQEEKLKYKAIDALKEKSKEGVKSLMDKL